MISSKSLINYFEKKRLFWWEPKDGRINVGDHLSYELVTSVLKMHGKVLVERQAAGKLLGIGSIMHFGNDGDTVWGSGINGKIDPKVHTFSSLDVRAVRGPLTKEFLENRGISCPDVFGDPGILAPLFYNKQWMQSQPESCDVLLIRHFNEGNDRYDELVSEGTRFLSPDCHPYQFIQAIVNAKRVVSSSLHGVILAEAYGIPAVYFKSGNGEHDFKYHDYYLGTGRQEGEYAFASSMEEALSINNKPIDKLSERQRVLLEAFPIEQW
ncbi:polysaccharide pyruvyl transferase family protein [Vibrio ulleungensis]|uniref:Polysaccharide pyruvyl transferase family protein n=1 Tax=Vibrio ulleungensis TaxID=2807619 RepID=A0ABS2HGY6_9VIBR|nr:polysaccharide pyruvyl transferase family protein [Vibrio ulleungensis]MBM7036289.1 polysaccharide pyruvyl transferase family protein [Vibrio ulleungensis]